MHPVPLRGCCVPGPSPCRQERRNASQALRAQKRAARAQRAREKRGREVSRLQQQLAAAEAQVKHGAAVSNRL
jgi:hypothetical protein